MPNSASLRSPISAVIAILLLASGLASAQKPVMGITVQPAFSKARIPNGVGIEYPGPPQWNGELVVKEESVNAYEFGVFLEDQTRWKNLNYQVSLGYNSLGALQTFSYDWATSTSATGIVSKERRFEYLSLGFNGKYAIPLKDLAIVIGTGVHVGYLVRSMETNTYWSNGNFIKANPRSVAGENSFNYGPRLDAGIRYGRLGVSASWKYYVNEHVNHEYKRVFMYGLECSYLFEKSACAKPGLN